MACESHHVHHALDHLATLEFEKFASAFNGFEVNFVKFRHLKAEKVRVFKLLEHVNRHEARVDIDHILAFKPSVLHHLQ